MNIFSRMLGMVYTLSLLICFDLLATSSANTSQSFGSSPRLTTSDNCLLDPAFWINHPTRLHTIRQLLCDSGNAEDDWLDEL
jgi:hypothetical protein